MYNQITLQEKFKTHPFLVCTNPTTCTEHKEDARAISSQRPPPQKAALESDLAEQKTDRKPAPEAI
jgi:hypothetical protein